MVELSKDKKSGTWIVTTTDSEGFHRQLNLTDAEMRHLIAQYMNTFYIEHEAANPPKIPRGC